MNLFQFRAGTKAADRFAAIEQTRGRLQASAQLSWFHLCTKPLTSPHITRFLLELGDGFRFVK